MKSLQTFLVTIIFLIILSVVSINSKFSCTGCSVFPNFNGYCVDGECDCFKGRLGTTCSQRSLCANCTGFNTVCLHNDICCTYNFSTNDYTCNNPYEDRCKPGCKENGGVCYPTNILQTDFVCDCSLVNKPRGPYWGEICANETRCTNSCSFWKGNYCRFNECSCFQFLPGEKYTPVCALEDPTGCTPACHPQHGACIDGSCVCQPGYMGMLCDTSKLESIILDTLGNLPTFQVIKGPNQYIINYTRITEVDSQGQIVYSLDWETINWLQVGIPLRNGSKDTDGFIINSFAAIPGKGIIFVQAGKRDVPWSWETDTYEIPANHIKIRMIFGWGFSTFIGGKLNFHFDVDAANSTSSFSVDEPVIKDNKTLFVKRFVSPDVGSSQIEASFENFANSGSTNLSTILNNITQEFITTFPSLLFAGFYVWDPEFAVLLKENEKEKEGKSKTTEIIIAASVSGGVVVITVIIIVGILLWKYKPGSALFWAKREQQDTILN